MISVKNSSLHWLMFLQFKDTDKPIILLLVTNTGKCDSTGALRVDYRSTYQMNSNNRFPDAEFLS